MQNIKPGMLYISVDGDSIGAKVGRAVLANDVDELHKVSARIDAAQDYIQHWCKQFDGIKISGGGDESTMAIPPEHRHELEDLRSGIEKSFGYTISVGVGKSLSEAGTALLVAKIRGKDRIVYFNEKVKEDIKKAKRRVREGRASQEENKLSEAYLSKAESMVCNLHKKELHKKHVHKMHKHEEGFHDQNEHEDMEDNCPMCADNEDTRTDDCQLCADLDAEENADGTAGMHDCPMCKEYDSADQETGAIDDCPYCESETVEEADAGTPAEQDAEDEHCCNCPDCPENDQTGLAVEDMGAEHPDNCPECQQMYSDAIENQPDQTGQTDPNLQGHKTAEEVLGLLDQEPGTGAQTPEAEAKKIDNTELPQGDQMKGNTSVKEDFGQAQKNDISDSESEMAQDHDCNCPNCDKGAAVDNNDPTDDQDSENSEEEPDMAGVLQSGIDDHANEQKKQQVLDMVGQTLAGFKSNKASLEATKEQNQPLYNSCIQMLKSMIELCKLLGLEPKMPESGQMPAQSGQESGQMPQAASSEEAAQDPKTQAG